jgi:Rps23 Pro-64 3,4-dihydroxylase Tpa1-like proline 4-hydroxylase
VSIVSEFHTFINARFPDAKLSSKLASNKLAVCVGDGSSYDKHFDNSGGTDLRKLTVLYYLQTQPWTEDKGGCFRIYTAQKKDHHSEEEEASQTTAYATRHNDCTEETVYHMDIEPIGDRLLVFWSDCLVHSVTPSFCPAGEADHRYALTVWITATDSSAICVDDTEVKIYFRAKEINSLNLL